MLTTPTGGRAVSLRQRFDIRDKRGNAYTVVNLKGVGSTERIEQGRSAFTYPYKHPMTSMMGARRYIRTTKGMFNKLSAEREWSYLNLLLNHGVRTAVPLALIRLDRVSDRRGRIIPTEEAKKKGVIKGEPVVLIRGLRSPVRVLDLRGFKSKRAKRMIIRETIRMAKASQDWEEAVRKAAKLKRNVRLDAERHMEEPEMAEAIERLEKERKMPKKEAEDLLKEAIREIEEEARGALVQAKDQDLVNYAVWFSAKLGKDLATMHNLDLSDKFFTAHNVTLACEKLDFDSVRTKEDLKGRLRSEQRRDITKAQKGILADLASGMTETTGKAITLYTWMLDAFTDSYSKNLSRKKRNLILGGPFKKVRRDMLGGLLILPKKSRKR